jgi:hypothetical protein
MAHMQFCSQKKCLTIVAAALLAALFLNENCHAQMITGVWTGRINKQKAELKNNPERRQPAGHFVLF